MKPEEWEDEEEKPTPKPKPWTDPLFVSLGVCALIAILIGLIASGAFAPSAETVVTDYLEAVISKEPTDEYLSWDGVDDNEIQGTVIRGYEIKNASRSSASVTVIFESQAHTDLRHTLRFTVKKGKITSIK